MTKSAPRDGKYDIAVTMGRRVVRAVDSGLNEARSTAFALAEEHVTRTGEAARILIKRDGLTLTDVTVQNSPDA